MHSDQIDAKKDLLPFSSAEYERRLHGLRTRMSAAGVESLVVFTPQNINYCTGAFTIGFANLQALIVPRAGDLLHFVREMERPVAETTSRQTFYETFSDDQDPVERLAEVISGGGWAKPGLAVELQGGFTTVAQMRRLETLLGSFLDGSGLVEAGRRIKSDEEAALMRKASAMTAAGMEAAFLAIAPGATDSDVSAAAATAMLEAGSEFFAIQPIVTSGWRSGVAHTTFSHRPLEDGDALLLEFSGCCGRYHGPLMRTAVFGRPHPEIERMYAVVEEALERAIEAIRPGAVSGEVDEACRRPIERAGLEDMFKKRTGYSVGGAYPPDWGEGHIVSLRRGDPTPLESGMVFHVPPALRALKRFAVGCSETVLVTATGAEALGRVPRSLRIVE